MASVKENGKKPKPCRHHMTIMRELFGYIDATGMKRGKFAAKAGYAHTSLCHYASGQSTPNLQAFLNLCEAAGISVLLVPNEHVAAHNQVTYLLNHVTFEGNEHLENKYERTDQTSA